ncbi:MAG: proline--tRNA ligase [Streptosporangiales bacterium]
MSTLFLRTLREDPADAEVPSHRLLVRAGYIRRTAPGIYSWLPLGWRTYLNVERIVREEMDAAGFQEVHFPALLPKEPYERTNRWLEYGDDIFRLQDRRGNDMLLAPTHEEMFALAVRDLYSSYKDLPLAIYQIQWKYRDEPRPRAGILRGREFCMKDSYSFDVDDAGFRRSYERHREAYKRLLDRLGLDYVIVQAMSGAMGGSASEEFLTPLGSGEDQFVQCTSCDYAANTEAVEVGIPQPVPYDGVPAAHVEETPDTPTIQTLVDLLNSRPDLRRDDRSWTTADMLKNVMVKLVHPDGKSAPLAVGVPGDREVDTKRLAAQVYPDTIEQFTDEDFAGSPGLVKGYIGPQALGVNQPAGVRYLADPRIVAGTRWVTGANLPGRHVVDLVAGRDFTADGTVEATDVRAGDPCPRCGAALTIARGIEMGHVFELGRKYAEVLDLTVLDEKGARVVPTMGSYGFGVSRALAVLAEKLHDDKGLVWPREVSPADVHLVAAAKDDAVFDAAERFAADLESRGVEVLYDDRRGVSAGVKFNDAELLGVPTVVVIGRGLADGKVEVRDRATGEREDVAVDDAAAHVAGVVRG